MVWAGLVTERSHLREIYRDAGSSSVERVVSARHDFVEYQDWNPLRAWTSERYVRAIENRLREATTNLSRELVSDIQRSIRTGSGDWRPLALNTRQLVTAGGRSDDALNSAYQALQDHVLEQRLFEPVRNGRIKDPREGLRLCQEAMQLFVVTQQRPALTRLMDQFRLQWDYADCHAITLHRQRYPSDLDGLEARMRQYLRDHPRGLFRTAARHYLSWSARIRSYRPYTVQLEEIFVDSDHVSTGDGAPEIYVTIQTGRRTIRSEPLPTGYHQKVTQRFDHGVRWRRGEPIRIEVWDSDTLQDDELFELQLHGDLALDQMSRKIVHRNGHWLRFRTTLEVPELPAVPDLQPVTLDASVR